LLRPEGILLLEAKLSYRASAWDQMRLLYAPLLQHIFSARVDCVLVTKYLPRCDEEVVVDPAALADGVVWHWMEVG